MQRAGGEPVSAVEELHCARTAIPSHGRDWDEAVAFGIDVSLLEDKARLTPAQRIAELVRMNRFHASIHANCMSEGERQAAFDAELAEELATYGPERP